MNVDERFFRVMGSASLGAAGLVLVAQYGLRYATPTTTDAVMAVYADPVFRAQSWLILVQVFLMFLALWGVTLKGWRGAPGLILTGFLLFLFWQILELLPRTYELFTQSYGLAPAYLAAESDAERARILATMRQAGAVLDGLGHTRRFFWGAGHLLFGVALIRGSGMARMAGALFLLNAARLVLRMLGEAADLDGLVDVVVGRTQFVVTMVPLFVVVGWWLWKDAATDPALTVDSAAGATRGPR